ncbi:efflux RND transporter periplasmic adaptor subunit [Paracoccus methylarcula]|uniref:Efflux RND transporter periplasmic adaptor subunit n=1 Tax=Paracoccus methylarcula TaxID=72022 RepID=A0A3R7LNQ4_9RHOB|nr:efflux RND transporter periplasmic adaptor subunit [Paracoccus methylarcula]RNF33597.1 efflux RND transporter periplasmic adaptor subunit [Paracoccus methylarcula]
MRILSIALLVAGLAWPAIAEDGDSSVNSTESVVERSVPSVTVTSAERTEVQARVPVVGTLMARQEVQVYSQVSGHEITELLVEAGDSVEKGQVLARLSTDTLAARLAQAEAGYQQAEAALKQAVTTLERARRLRSSNNASQATLDDAVAAEANAQAGLAQAEAARRIAQLDLDRAEITAPVSGLVVERNAVLGGLSGSASGPLFTLLADGKIEMSAEVIETALQKVSIGDPAEIRVAGLGSITGEVRLIPASVDPVTRLGKMRISLEAVPGLRTGLFASGWVITAKREAVTVPATAVLSDDQGDRVQVVEDGVVRSRPVKAGLLWQERREILEGIEEGEQVIARSGAFFRDGDMVKAVSSTKETEDETASATTPAEGTRRP